MCYFTKNSGAQAQILHHEVVDVHGPGPLLTEASLLQNAFDFLADAEVGWNVLQRRREKFWIRTNQLKE